MPPVVIRGQGDSRDLIFGWFGTSGEEEPAASTEIQTAGHAGRPPNDDNDAVWARRASRASRRPYARATHKLTEPRRSLRDRAASRLGAAAVDNARAEDNARAGEEIVREDTLGFNIGSVKLRRNSSY